MSRIATVCVVVMILVAGCSGATPNGESPSGEGDISLDEASTVTYTNETANMTYTVEVNHETETYDMWIEANQSPPHSELGVELATGIYCGALQEAAYNYTANEENNVTDTAATYTKAANGESESVEQIPAEIFTDYTPERVDVTVYKDDWSEHIGHCEVVDSENVNTTISVED